MLGFLFIRSLFFDNARKLVYAYFYSYNLAVVDSSMSFIPLHNIYSHQLNLHSCCITAEFLIAPTKHNKRLQQRTGVRQLLEHLMHALGIVDSLDDSHYPYRLLHHRHYVGFSHSTDKIAVAISSQRPIAIDIETHYISWQVAQRFYHPNELDILEQLSLIERNHMTKCLWQIKECYIKINDSKLATGLGIDYSMVIPKLMNMASSNDSLSCYVVESMTDFNIAVLPKQQSIIVY